MMIDKKVFMDFLSYIRSKDKVFIDPVVITVDSVWQHTIDKTSEVCEIVNAIREAPTVDVAYENAYHSILKYANQFNPSWREHPGLLFYEDVYDYFVNSGMFYEEAKRYARRIASGCFEEDANANCEYLNSFCNKKNILHWAKAVNWLPHRLILTTLLRTEYKLFLNNNYQ